MIFPASSDHSSPAHGPVRMPPGSSKVVSFASNGNNSNSDSRSGSAATRCLRQDAEDLVSIMFDQDIPFRIAVAEAGGPGSAGSGAGNVRSGGEAAQPAAKVQNGAPQVQNVDSFTYIRYFLHNSFSLSLSQDPALGGRGGVASSSSAAAQSGAQDDIATIFKVIC